MEKKDNTKGKVKGYFMYEMKPEYYIGIDMIDEEHKQLDQQSRGMCRHSSELLAQGLQR